LAPRAAAGRCHFAGRRPDDSLGLGVSGVTTTKDSHRQRPNTAAYLRSWCRRRESNEVVKPLGRPPLSSPRPAISGASEAGLAPPFAEPLDDGQPLGLIGAWPDRNLFRCPHAAKAAVGRRVKSTHADAGGGNVDQSLPLVCRSRSNLRGPMKKNLSANDKVMRQSDCCRG
jgi:hypothetical protein